MPDTQARERTALARQRSSLAFTFIGALLMTHSHAWLGVAAGLIIAAAGWSSHSPRALAATAMLAAAFAALILTV